LIRDRPRERESNINVRNNEGGDIRLTAKIREVIRVLQEKKALDIRVFQLKNLTTIADYFVICTAESIPQSRAIAEAVALRIKERFPLQHKEGFPQNNWLLMDYGDFILHIFQPETREFYALEKIWGDAPNTLIREAGEAEEGGAVKKVAAPKRREPVRRTAPRRKKTGA